MSNLQDLPNCSKPINRVEDVLLDMNKKLDNMKVDVGCIKSDLKIILKRIDEKQKQEYFSSVLVTVNKFLAPFERILDFRILPINFNRNLNVDFL